MTPRQLQKHRLLDLRMRQAREKIEVLIRLRASGNSRDEIVSFHELHARHERERGNEDSAAHAEARARAARKRS